MAPPVSLTNTVFAKGYVFLTPSGGTTDSRPCAQLQEIEVQMQLDLAEMMGPGQLTAVAVAAKGKKITGKFKNGVLRANMFKDLFGGSSAYASSVTTVSHGVDSDPTKFNLHFMTPSDGSDMELKLYGCVCTDISIKAQNHEFIYFEASFNCYGDGTNTHQEILPGDQTNS